MAFNFPASPTIGQTYTPSPGITYVWTGGQWDRTTATAGPFVMPAGVIMAFAGTVLPAGALWCDGNTFNQASYPVLYAALGNSNVTPDLRGRVIVGLDRQVAGAYANRVTNAGVGNPGLDSKTMKATGGFDRFTIAVAQMPTHGHYGEGTTSNVSADHSHWVAGTTGNDTVNHTHYISGYTDTHAGHVHYYVSSNANDGGGGSQYQNTATLQADSNTGTAGAHNHTINFASGTVSAWHQHGFGVSSGGISANHTHTYSFTAAAQGGNEAHPNMQPSMVLNYIIFTGAMV